MTAFSRRAKAILVGLVTLAAPAAAAPNDSAATRLADQAMNQHFVATEFDAAKEKLEKAIARCETGCSDSVRARLHRDLGVVMITGFSDKAAGEREFAAARAADPGIELDPLLTTPEVKAAFERSQKEEPPQAEKKSKRRTHRRGGAEAKALEHEPVTEQRVRTPVPIYVEPADPESISSGVLNFKSSAGPWQRAPLKRMGDGFGAEIPCSAVRHTGQIVYYVEVKDDSGDVVGSAGSRDEPIELEIGEDKPDEPPHFPDHDAPPRCGALGGACEEDADCSEQAICSANRCVAGGQSPLTNVTACLQFLERQAVAQVTKTVHRARRKAIQEDAQFIPPRHWRVATIKKVRRTVAGG